MTSQELIDALSALEPASVRDARVIISQRQPGDFFADVDSVRYEEGEVIIEVEPYEDEG